jgi:hypothetical protein
LGIRARPRKAVRTYIEKALQEAHTPFDPRFASVEFGFAETRLQFADASLSASAGGKVMVSGRIFWAEAVWPFFLAA